MNAIELDSCQDDVLTPAKADNTALVVVLYEPDDKFQSRLRTAASQFPTTFIIDNSEQFVYKPVQDLSNPVHYHRIGYNCGLGEALNIGCQMAVDHGFNWVVTLDQDTVLEKSYLDDMITAASLAPANTALLGCNYFSESRSSLRYNAGSGQPLKEMTTVITSGCLTNLRIWETVGRFREDYFIDSIDHEMCLRAHHAGAAIMCNLQPLMSHTIGHKNELPLGLSRMAPYRHSVARKYTSTRNTVRTMLDHGSSNRLWCIKKIAGVGYELLFTIFAETEKLRRLKAYFLGIRHGFSAKLGAPPDNL